MTTFYNFYAGPGAGKSTTASGFYFKGKLRGGEDPNVDGNGELIREYIKNWVWEGRKILPYDQVYILGKQLRLEDMLCGKVSWAVTDSPVLLSLYYARKFAPVGVAAGIESIVKAYYQNRAKEGHVHHHIFLKRTKRYNKAGRFQTEDEAKVIDEELLLMLPELGITPIIAGTSNEEIEELMRQLVPGYK